MATADEYRSGLETKRAALHAAIEAAGDGWEQAPEGDEEWSPRAVAEHVVGSEYYFAGLVAAAMQGKAPDRPSELSFDSNKDALSALDEASEAADKTFRYVEDRDLEKAAELDGGDRFASTIEGVLQLATWHRDDHTKQIRAAS